MKLTPNEQAICDKYKQRDETGHVHCRDCPLVIDKTYCVCYKNLDERSKEAYELGRY